MDENIIRLLVLEDIKKEPPRILPDGSRSDDVVEWIIKERRDWASRPQRHLTGLV